MNKTLRHYFDLVVVLTQKEIKVRYKSSMLGYLWSVANPLAFALVFFVAFKVVMRVQMEDYALFLIAGLFPWQWFQNSVNASPLIFISNASIIKKVNFPRNLIPFTQVLQDMIHFVLAIPIIASFLLVYDRQWSVSWIYGIPLLLCVQFFTTYAVSLVVSSVNLFIRDLERLTTIAMTLLFYFTPVIYSEAMIPEQYRFLLKYNPVAPLMISWRNLFMDGELSFFMLSLSIFYALAFFLVAHYVYRRLSWKFAEIL